MTARDHLLTILADRIAQTDIAPVVFVGVDGVDGAGKTCFADELGQVVARQRRPVIRASVDGFHNPRRFRYRQGRHSPLGFFEDSYNYQAMRELLLDPLTSRGSREYCCAAFDVKTDAHVAHVYAHAQPGSVLLVDGIFLHREELQNYWHVSIWLETTFEVSVGRLASRDGSPPDPMHTANARYVEGQRLYFSRCQPQSKASVVVNNDDLNDPYIIDREHHN